MTIVHSSQLYKRSNEFDTKNGPIRFRAQTAAIIDKWCACLPQVMRYSQSGSSAMNGSALSKELKSRRCDELSARLHGHERGVRWVVGMDQGEFASAIDTLGAKMTRVVRTSRATACGGGGQRLAEGEPREQEQEQEQPAQVGGHAGAVRSGAAGTIVKDSTVGEAIFYEETAPRLAETLKWRVPSMTASAHSVPRKAQGPPHPEMQPRLLRSPRRRQAPGSAAHPRA